MERETTGLHARVGKAFASATGPNVIHIDGTCGEDEVELRAWEVVRSRLSETFPNGTG
jgi:hypothetical protein